MGTRRLRICWPELADGGVALTLPCSLFHLSAGLTRGSSFSSCCSSFCPLTPVCGLKMFLHPTARAPTAAQL